jgi:hypothetical protein
LTGIIDRRIVNAFFPDAKPRSMLPFGWLVYKQAKWMFGGLWVGGEAILHESQLVFEPNALNRSVHADPDSLSVCLPLQNVLNVSLRDGKVTDIIDIQTNSAVFSIRCFNAKDFADHIETQSRAAKD